MVPKIQEIKSIAFSKDGWDLLLDNKESATKVETKKSVRGFQIVRGQGAIDFPPIEVFRCMACKQYLNEYALNTDHTAFRKKIGANAYIYYNRTKPKIGFQARDFICNYLINIEQDGTLVIVSTSYGVDYDEPKHSGITRGDAPIRGWVIIPNQNDPSKSYCYIVNEVDLKTVVPNFILRQAQKDQGLQVERLRGCLPKWKKLYPNDKIE